MIVVMLILNSVTGLAQKHPILDRLELKRVGEEVSVDMTISLGFFCNGINIFRSDDLSNPQLIGRISGICGSNDSPTFYSFTDENPIQNKKSYYWVEPGGYDLSEPISITFIEFIEKNYIVIPHPIVGESMLYLENDLAVLLRFKLTDLSGRVVFEQETRGNNLNIMRGTIPPGVYTFMVLNQDNSLHTSGKLIFQ
jgi:hypothetical protein